MDVTPNFEFIRFMNGQYPGAVLSARLFQGIPPIGQNPAVANFPEANFPGYEAAEPLLPAQSRVSGAVQAFLSSEMEAWGFYGNSDAENVLGGAIIVCVFPNGDEALVGYTFFANTVTMNKLAMPFGLTFAIFAQRSVVRAP